MYIYQFQQATIFTATLLFQPQLITTMYIQLTLQMISIYIVSLLFYTHAHTHYFIHSIVVKYKKSSDAPIKTETFSDKKCELQTRSCLTMVSVQSARFISFNHRFRRFLLSGRDSRNALTFQIEASTTSLRSSQAHFYLLRM